MSVSCVVDVIIGFGVFSRVLKVLRCTRADMAVEMAVEQFYSVNKSGKWKKMLLVGQGDKT